MRTNNAWNEGAEAAGKGLRPSANPYNGFGGLDDQARQNAWFNGWHFGRLQEIDAEHQRWVKAQGKETAHG